MSTSVLFMTRSRCLSLIFSRCSSTTCSVISSCCPAAGGHVDPGSSLQEKQTLPRLRTRILQYPQVSLVRLHIYMTSECRVSYEPNVPCFISPSPTNFLDQTQEKGLVMAVFGLVFSKLAMLVIAPDPLPFSKDTPEEIKGAYFCVYVILHHFGQN